MNSEIKSPVPSKILKHFLLKSLTAEERKPEENLIQYTKDVKELLAMRSNSQNPHEKDENFKCQSVESFGEIEMDWEKFEDEEFCDYCK